MYISGSRAVVAHVRSIFLDNSMLMKISKYVRAFFSWKLLVKYVPEFYAYENQWVGSMYVLFSFLPESLKVIAEGFGQ